MKLVAVLTAAAALAGSTVTVHAETLRFSSFEPPVAFITSQILTPWAADVSAASNGALDIEIFAGGSLGRDPAQQLALVENGVADIAWIVPGYTPGRFAQATVAELPFLVQTATAGSRAMWEMYESGQFAGDFENFKMLGIFATAPNFIGANVPVRVPSDAAGLNFRAPGPTLLSAIEAIGAVPVGGITGPTVAESVNRGLIAGTLTNWNAAETFRMEDVLTQYNTVPLGATPLLVVMNRARYDSLPEEARAAIDEFSGAALSERFGAAFDENNANGRERMLATGTMEVIDPDEALAAQWREAVAVATSDWIANNENGQVLYDAFVAALGRAENQ